MTNITSNALIGSIEVIPASHLLKLSISVEARCGRTSIFDEARAKKDPEIWYAVTAIGWLISNKRSVRYRVKNKICR